MARPGRLLLVSALLGVALVAAAAVAFVGGPLSTRGALAPRVPSLSGQAEHSAVVSSTERPASLQPAAAAPAAAAWKWLGAGLVAGLLLAAAVAPEPAQAEPQLGPYSFSRFDGLRAVNTPWLQPCKDNKKFHKKVKDNVYKLEQRQKKYPKDSVVYNRFVSQIAQIKNREQAYGDRFCGKKDGLPRTIVTGEFVRGGIVVPGLIFLYTTGWIGWAGRSYLIRTQDEKKELSIDVPLALTCMASGFAWPVAAWQDIVNGKMVVNDKDLHRSGLAGFDASY